MQFQPICTILRIVHLLRHHHNCSLDTSTTVNFAVSRQTVNRRLVARAYRARPIVKVPRLTVRAKLVRRHWAQKHINQPLGQWQHVIFCDESRFMLFRIDNRIRVRRLVVEAMNEDCTHGKVAHGGGCYVHVWGCISRM